MVYVTPTYTVAEILCASGFRCIDGIWVHVSLKFFGNSQWLVSLRCMIMRILHKFAQLHPLRRLEPPSHPFEGAKS